MKAKCTGCLETKEAGSFYKDKSKKFGLTSRCRDCFNRYYGANHEKIRLYHGTYYKKNRIEIIEKYMSYTRTLKGKLVRAKAKKKYSLTPNGIASRNKAIRKSMLVHKDHWLARDEVKRSVRKGLLKKENCICGSKVVDAHHYAGYEKANWLKVQWLCQEHHKEVHGKTHLAPLL